MSERSGYMAELDQWTEDTVLRPINRAWQEIASAQSQEERDGAMEGLAEVESQVRRAIREKALESYHNGRRSKDQPSTGRTADERPRRRFTPHK